MAKYTLNKKDVKVQAAQAIRWLIPLILIYIVQLQGTLSKGGIIPLSEFVPTGATIGAVELYVCNQIFGLLQKYIAE